MGFNGFPTLIKISLFYITLFLGSEKACQLIFFKLMFELEVP